MVQPGRSQAFTSNIAEHDESKVSDAARRGCLFTVRREKWKLDISSLSQEKLEQAVSGNTGKRNKSTSKPVKDWENKDSIIVAERIAKMSGDTLESMVQFGGNGYAYEDLDGITIQVCYDEDKDRFKRDIFFNEKIEDKSVNKQGSSTPTSETVELSRHL